MKNLIMTAVLFVAFSSAFASGIEVGDEVKYKKTTIGVITNIQVDNSKKKPVYLINIASTEKYHREEIYDFQRYFKKQNGVKAKFYITKIEKVENIEVVESDNGENEITGIQPYQQPNTAAYHLNEAARHSREGKTIGLSTVVAGTLLAVFVPPAGLVVLVAGGTLAIVKSYKHDSELEEAAKILNH